MSEAPAELWLRPVIHDNGRWFQTHLDSPEPDAVRYVRADLYEALLARAQQEVASEARQSGELGKACDAD